MGRVTVIGIVLIAGCGARSGLREPPPIITPAIDAGLDAPVLDALVLDTGRDTGSEAGFDAGSDAGFDAGSDAGNDVGIDAPPNLSGCADGEREAFGDIARYPRIAGCAGGWTRPGIAHAAPASCDGQGGDDGPFPGGGTCGVSDLCALGWHVCATPDEVGSRSPDGCDGSHDAPDAFFAMRTSGSGCGVCATGTATDCSATDCRRDCAQTSITVNDVFGCGTVGSTPDATCGPLDRFGNNLCDALPSPWACSDDGSGTHEAELVTKPGADHGGVLCCAD